MSPKTSDDITPSRAVGELVLGSGIWGFGFIATVWAFHLMSPAWMSTSRFLVAAVTAAPFVAWKWPQVRLGFLPGLFLMFTIVLQAWGLKYTTPTKSGFITCLYVVFVPMIEAAFFGRKIHRLHSLFVLVALVGAALICQWDEARWNFGDLLTVLAALFASGQIISIGRFTHKVQSAMAFNTYQSLWAGLLALPIALFEGPVFLANSGTEADLLKAWAGVIFLTYGSTMFAFLLQIRAQRALSPTVSSMLFLLESPFAAFFSWALLSEILTVSQWAGAGLVLVAAFATIRFETRPA